MKKNNFWLAILAILFAATIGAVGCGEDPADNNNNTPKPIKFISSDSSGNTYTLTITPGTADTVKAGDSYELAITNGSTKNVSKGTISNIASGVLTMKPKNSEETFTVTMSGEQMTNISGTIAVEGSETPVTGPGTVTPGSNNNNGNGEVTDSTFTLTGIPAQYNGKYAILMATNLHIGGAQSINTTADTITLVPISNGSVRLPMWEDINTDTWARYSGNDTAAQVNVVISSLAASSLEFGDSFNSAMAANVTFNSVTFKNGGATRSWSQGQVQLNPGGGGDIAVTLNSVTPNGSNAQTTTQLTLTFSQAITGLTADDITLTGVSGVSKGALSNSGANYTLPIGGFSVGGTLNVAVAKSGYTISGSPKNVTIYYYSGSGGGGGTYGDFTYTETANAVTITGYTGAGGSVTIPAQINGKPVTTIGERAFSGETSITSVIIPDSVTSIGKEAFYNTNQLKSITIPNSVITIGQNAFYYCDSLISVAIPNSVTTIGNGAFLHCNSLTSVTIPNSVTSIGNLAFDSDSLTEINVDAANSAYSSQDGVLYNKDKTTLIQYPKGKTGSTFSIPNSVTSIGLGAFSSCELTSVTIPNSVTSIGESAFYSCYLTSVTIPSSVASIGYLSFANCIYLVSVTFQGTIPSSGLNQDAFTGDLRAKYLAGGIGTYKTTTPVPNLSWNWNPVWTKQ